MKVRVLGSGARPEAVDDALLVVPDRSTAGRLRARRSTLRVLVAGDRLPFADGVLAELVDERATSLAALEEDARAVHEGGRLSIVSDGPGAGRLTGMLGGLWKKARHPVAPTDASAWLLGVGCTELEQHATKDGVVVTSGRVARSPS